nr:MAG TPA: hypothetical protein [Caudoviricetes sp.]
MNALALTLKLGASITFSAATANVLAARTPVGKVLATAGGICLGLAVQPYLEDGIDRFLEPFNH